MQILLGIELIPGLACSFSLSVVGPTRCGRACGVREPIGSLVLSLQRDVETDRTTRNIRTLQRRRESKRTPARQVWCGDHVTERDTRSPCSGDRCCTGKWDDKISFRLADPDPEFEPLSGCGQTSAEVCKLQCADQNGDFGDPETDQLWKEILPIPVQDPGISLFDKARLIVRSPARCPASTFGRMNCSEQALAGLQNSR